MLLNRSLRIIVALLFFSNSVCAQKKYPSTLLWKITGKNLLQPSYLFGTMHVQDRRLFFFTDSLYNAIEKTDAFAMEINPDEMMDSMILALQKKDTSDFLKNILNESEYKKISKQLEKKLKIPADKITARKLAEERRRLKYTPKRADDMSAIMDLYLFSIARKQGKITVGIEDVADQFEVVNEIGKFNIDDFIKNDTALQINYLERMKKIYLDKDLSSLDNMVNGDLNKSFEDLLLIKRNKKMAVRMDSLLQIRSSFFAVGAAHLPGDSGVITLLQQRGLLVEPVLSGNIIAPEAYKYTVKEIPWITVEDENKMCQVQMPGNPTPVMAEKVLPMKMYIDITDLSVYGLAVTALPGGETNADTIFQRLIETYKKNNYEVKSLKNIQYKNCRGIEMHALQKGQGEYRYRIIIKENKLFMVIFGVKEGGELYTDNAEKFFTSLFFNEENIAGKNNWQKFVNARNAFSMMAPGKIVESKQKDEEGVEFDNYSMIDYSDGSYYMVAVKETKPGFIIENDSIYFEEYKKNLNVYTGNKVKEFYTLSFKDYTACHFVALQTQNNAEFVLQGYLIRRGNRTYMPMVVSSKERADFPNVTNFFRSFSPEPIIKTPFKKQVLNNGFSTYAPASFEKIKSDTAEYGYNGRLQTYQVRDINSAANYSVEIESFLPYYWSNADTSFFKERSNSFKKYNDSLISYTYHNDTVKNAEVLIKIHGADLYKKLKIYLNGDSLYTLYAYLTEKDLKEENSNTFFNSTAFAVYYPSSIFKNKAAELFTALHSNDSITVSEVKQVLKDVSFTKEDLPLLYKAVLKNYKNFEEDYKTTNEILGDEIIKIQDSSIINFVKQTYAVKNDSTADIQMMQLEMLAENKTSDSYALLKNLLLNQPPVKGNVYNLMYAMQDTLELLKDFFPEATKLYSDTVVGSTIIKLGNQLVDSNMLMPAIVLQNNAGVFSLAKHQYNQIKKDKENAFPPFNAELISFLGKFKSEEANSWLNKFVSIPDLWVKNNAVLALLKNNQPVSTAEIKKFASNKSWRSAFYNSLNDINKVNLFPKEFYTQQKFAESYLAVSLEEDYEVETKSIQFLKEMTGFVNGKQLRFLLYKVILNDEDDIKPHLAICGGFAIDKKIAEIADADLEIYFNYDEALELNQIDKQFKKYLDDKIKSSNESK